MEIQRRTRVVVHTHLATTNKWDECSHSQRHNDTLIGRCSHRLLSLTYNYVDIGMGREKRSTALDRRRSGRASVLSGRNAHA